MSLDLYTLAQRLVGEIQERPGPTDHHPFILWCHEATTLKATTDEVAWCSSFLNRLAQLCGLPRTKSAAARSWLTVGTPIPYAQAQPGDVVILKRGPAPQPGPEVTNAPGHVCLWASAGDPFAPGGPEFFGLGGNQGNGVTIRAFKAIDILGIRRLTV